jgi:hypothetical protein
MIIPQYSEQEKKSGVWGSNFKLSALLSNGLGLEIKACFTKGSEIILNYVK